jgi:hypothetical protein
VVQVTCTNLQKVTTARKHEEGRLIKKSEGLFNAITQALIFLLSLKKKLVLATVI